MIAHRGRSSYLPPEKVLGNIDPGAKAISILFHSIQNTIYEIYTKK